MYTCKKSKEQILATIVEHFQIANEAYGENHDDMRFGAYKALSALVRELEIYGEEK